MSSPKSDVLLEIGCEELPASFVEAALEAIPILAKKKLAELRLGFGNVRALGTPRRLALLVEDLEAEQADLAEELTGPPTRAAFKDGVPTRAAEAFAEKVGVTVAELRRVDTPKGEYLVGTRKEKGRATQDLLPGALESLIKEIPFRKSMRWADLDFAFGRPIQWLVALYGTDVLDLGVASLRAGRETLGHRFLARAGTDRAATPERITLKTPRDYVTQMREVHVLVDPEERRAMLAKKLLEAVEAANGVLIEDEFLMGENLSLVEEPYVVTGTFAEEFLELPERVILEVAKGHQRYFGIRDKSGKLLPSYLTVVNTALEPAIIAKGNDRVMRARLADARFFYKTDLDVPLADRREKLAGVVFQKRLGSVLEKATRVERLATEIGLLLSLPEPVIMAAASGAHLAKCDLVSLMVGEFPELQGDMGMAYALAQGVAPEVASVIRDHYKPKGAHDDTAKDDAAALVALADRLDTLVGCFAIGLAPTGAADPFALRRACLGVLRTMLDRDFDLSFGVLLQKAYHGFEAIKLDLSRADLVAKVTEFMTERLRGLLADKLPADAVRACLAAGSERPLDARARATALAELDSATRAQVGEVFKRATNIAKEAPSGDPAPPPADAHASESALYEAYIRFRNRSSELAKTGDYDAFLREVAAIAPVMEKYFLDVFVMCDDLPLRESRLRLMREISERCASVARLELLAAS